MEAETTLSSVKGGRLTRKVSAGWLASLVDAHGFWALTDQGVVSLGNFATTIVLARALAPQEYGTWAVIFGLLLFLNVLHASLISYPLTLIAATGDDIESRSGFSAALGLTILLALPLGLVVISVSWLIGIPQVGLLAWLTLFAWQLQETTRRALIARFSCRKAIWGDAVSYLLQAAILWWLWRNGELTLARSFAVLAATYFVAAIVQAFQLGRLLNRPSLNVKQAREFWNTGRWVLWSNLATNFSIQAVPWALFVIRGPVEAAAFQAISNLQGVAHPVMLSLGNVVVPAAARARAREGLTAARRVAFKYAAQGGLLLLPFFAAQLIYPRQLLGIFYGSGSAYVVLDSALRFLTVAYAMHYFSLSVKFLLNALEENRGQFVAELCGSVVLAILVVPLVMFFGLRGAIFVTTAWLGMRLIGNLITLRRVFRSRFA
jgi:O-antigen/teichoic acid export membrane protein